MKVGFIANPASGKDIRRLTARASVFDNQEKAAIVRRCVAGIEGVCPTAAITYYPDSHQIAKAALASTRLRYQPLDMACSGTSQDSTEAAAKMADVDVLVSLGGDGTNRAIAKSLAPDVPLIALSTGTNNAFPILCEATSAGMAAAYIGMRKVPLEEAAPRTKVVHIQFEDGDSDIALIDVVGTTDRFVGSRALVDPANFVFSILSVADPSKVGMTAIGGMVETVGDAQDHGLLLKFKSEKVREPFGAVDAAISPGMVQNVKILEVQRIALTDSVRLRSATVLAFDGEREKTVEADSWTTFSIRRDGPRRVDVTQCMRFVSNTCSAGRLEVFKEQNGAF